jgi:hypothetical protein
MQRAEPGTGKWRLVLGGLGPLLLVLVGCEGKGDITGKVTFKGEPIPWGRVTFLSEGGNKTAHPSRIINGRYTVRGCPTGLAQISVESFQAPKVDKAKLPEMMRKRVEENDPESFPPDDVVGKFLLIPLRYANPTTSELEYTVRRGGQEHDIDLGP